MSKYENVSAGKDGIGNRKRLRLSVSSPKANAERCKRVSGKDVRHTLLMNAL